MRILTLNLFFAFFLLNSFPISAKGGPSTFNAGVEISGLRKTGTDTTLLKIDNNSATVTYTLEAYASGTLKAYFGRNGNLKIGAMTTASRTALTPSSGEIVFDTDLTAFYGYDGSSWAELGSGGGTYNNTNTATYSANFVAGSNVTIVPSISGGIGTFTISASISGSGTNAISIQGTNVNNASPTATANQIIYDPNTAEYIASTPYHVQHINLATQGIWLAAGSNITIASSTDNGSTTFTITSSGGGSGDATSIQGTAVNNASPTAGDILLYDGAEWNITPVFANPMTTNGDIIYYNTGTATALAIGNNGDILSVSPTGFPEWVVPSSSGGSVTATTSLALTGNVAGQGEFYFEQGTGITITEYTGASTTWVISSTGGTDTITATPTIQNSSEIYVASDTSISSFTPKLNTSNSPTSDYVLAWNGTNLYYASATGDLGLANQAAAGILAVYASDTTEIDMVSDTVNASATISATIKDGSIGESRLNISNSPTAEYFLKTDGTNLIWAMATDTITASTTDTVTASPTALDTSEIDMTVSASNQVSGVLIDGSIAESRLNIGNAPVAEYFLKTDGTNLFWAVATDTVTATSTITTDTVTASPTLTGQNFVKVTSDSGINSFTVELDLGNSPTAEYFLKYDNGTGKIVFAQATDTITATGTNTITATTSLALTGNSPAQGEFYLEQGSNITITEYTGASTTWVISSTGGGGGSVTATTTLDLNGTTTNEPGEYFLQGAGGISVTQSGSAGSYTFTIDGSGVVGGGAATATLFFPHLAPTSDGYGGTTDTTKQTVYVASSSFGGVDFGSTIIPTEWDSVSSIPLSLYVVTPNTPLATDVVLELRAQYINSGSGYWRIGSYTTVATITFTLASSTNVQVLTDSSFALPPGSLEEKGMVYIQIFRIGGDAADTHTDQLHFYNIVGEAPKD